MKNPLEHGLFDIGNYLKDSIEEVKDYVSNGFSKIKRNVVKVGLPVSLALLTSYACSRPAPTPTHIPTPHPTPTSVIQLQKPSQPTPTVQLQRLTSPLIPTAIPTLALTPAAPSSVEISTSSCKRKIGIYNYSRTPSREGWEKIDGKLWIFGDCVVDGVPPAGIRFPEKFYLNDEGWFLNPFLRTLVGWEGIDYLMKLPLEKTSSISVPYTTYIARFAFEIPKITPSFYITFKPEKGIACNIGDPCGGGQPQADATKYISISGRLTSSKPNPNLYDEWFSAQIKPYFMRVGDSAMAGDIKLMLEEINTEPFRIRMKLENTSRGQDVPAQIPRIYFLDNSGSVLDELKNPSFSVEKTVLPPGYSTIGKLEFSLESLPQRPRYIMFSTSNRPSILELP